MTWACFLFSKPLINSHTIFKVYLFLEFEIGKYSTSSLFFSIDYWLFIVHVYLPQNILTNTQGLLPSGLLAQSAGLLQGRLCRVFTNSQDNCCYGRDQKWGRSRHLGTQCQAGVGVRWGQPPWGYGRPPPIFFYILRPRGCILDKFWPIWLSVLALLRKAFAA